MPDLPDEYAFLIFVAMLLAIGGGWNG